jgi:hypothetical protein
MSDSKENNNTLNGQATPDGVTASSKELHNVHKKLIDDLWGAWRHNHDAFSEDKVTFSRVSVVSLTQVAATCALDVKMTEEQFLATCKANYEAALKHAPRWS